MVGTHKLSDVFFVSSNIHKFKEAKEILDSFGISIQFFKLNLEEIQLKKLQQKKHKMHFQNVKNL